MVEKEITKGLEEDILRGMQTILNTSQCLDQLTEEKKGNFQVSLEDVERLINIIDKTYIPILEEYKDADSGIPVMLKLHKAHKYQLEQYKIPA